MHGGLGSTRNHRLVFEQLVNIEEKQLWALMISIKYLTGVVVQLVIFIETYLKDNNRRKY